eukprot:822910-Prorocentrum_lima.AAC.1
MRSAVAQWVKGSSGVPRPRFRGYLDLGNLQCGGGAPVKESKRASPVVEQGRRHAGENRPNCPCP